MSRVAVGDSVGLRFERTAGHLFDTERGYHAATDNGD
jgi:hypothetical protein